MRREIAGDHLYSPTEVFYCHHRFRWVVGTKECNEHCQMHVDDLGSKRCGTMTYCYTLVRPAYCPFCLGDQSKPSRPLNDSNHGVATMTCGSTSMNIVKDARGRCNALTLCAMCLSAMPGTSGSLHRRAWIEPHGSEGLEVPPTVGTIPATTPHEDELSHNKRKATEDPFALLWA